MGLWSGMGLAASGRWASTGMSERGAMSTTSEGRKRLQGSPSRSPGRSVCLLGEARQPQGPLMQYGFFRVNR
jgi:hypothetical protein